MTPPPADIPTDNGTHPTTSAPAYRTDLPTGRNYDKEITGPGPDPFAQRINFNSLTTYSILSSYGLQDNPKSQNRSFSQHLHLAKNSPKEGSLAPLLQRELLYSSGYRKYPLKGPRQEFIPGSPGKTSLEDDSSTPRFIQGRVLGTTMKKFFSLFKNTVHPRTK